MSSFLLTVDLDKEGEFLMPVQRQKLAFKGRDRVRIRQLRNYLKQIQAMDVRNQARSTELGIPATNFIVTTAANLTGQIAAIIARCDTALAQRMSMQANNPNDRV
jgi:hypothetical protein